MAKLDPHVITLSAFLLLSIILLLPTCQALADRFKSDGSDATIVSKDVTEASPVCVCGALCGYPCLYSSPPPPGELTPPTDMSPPDQLPSPPPPFGPYPTPMPLYPLYMPPPPRGEVYGANGGFVFYKPSLAWHRGVSRVQVLVCGVILVLLL